MASATISTGVRAIVPAIPFFFTHGNSAIVSLPGHFAVVASKSLATIRSWWASAFELTMIDVIVGVGGVSFGC